MKLLCIVALGCLVGSFAVRADTRADTRPPGVAAGKPGATSEAPQVWREPQTGMGFVRIPKGCYAMGQPRALTYQKGNPGAPLYGVEFRFEDETPQHEVCLDAFWLGRHEVRADEWQQVMGGAPPARPEAPVAGISWHEAQRFAARLTERAGGKYRFRLPTEAEWEYACRAGSKDEIVPQREELRDSAWYAVQPDGIQHETQPVGQLKPNAFGLHDMLGNVWEWTGDGYQANAYGGHGLYNPILRGSGPEKVIRGASFRSEPLQVRCAKRSQYPAEDALPSIGLRLVRTP